MSYEYNAKAHYAPYGKHQALISGKDLTQLDIAVKDDNEKSESFSIKVPDSIFDLGVYKYLKDGDFYDGGGFQTARSAYNFQHEPMRLWEVQLNFAVHCATSGLGVSTEHLNAKQPLVKALYRFHAYYHVRRILKRMLTPLPGQEGFDKYNNAFSLEEVRRVSDEYGVSTKALGIFKNKYYFDRSGKHGNYSYEHNNWSRWIMNSSHGFTKWGVEKISESIRAYSYLVLTSQVAARHGIRKALRSRGVYGNVRRVLDLEHYYYIATEYLDCICGKAFIAWDDRLLNQLPYATRSKFPASLTHKYAVDKSLLTLLRSRTLGNSPSSVQNSIAELHSENWMRRSTQYMQDCQRHSKGVSTLLGSDQIYPQLPNFAPVPSKKWFLTSYTLDVLSRIETLKGNVTSVFGRILKIDSTKKIVKKLAGLYICLYL